VSGSCGNLQAINRGAELVECTNAEVDLARVLGIQSFSMDRMLEMDPDFLVSCHSSGSSLVLIFYAEVDLACVLGISELQHGQDAGDGPRLPGELSLYWLKSSIMLLT
jgi:G3E family GTPase